VSACVYVCVIVIAYVWSRHRTVCAQGRIYQSAGMHFSGRGQWKEAVRAGFVRVCLLYVRYMRLFHCASV
jgi:hypothetical protein